MSERVVFHLEAAHLLQQRYRQAAEQLEDVADRVGRHLDVAEDLAGWADDAVVSGLVELADRLRRDGADLAWRVELAAAGDIWRVPADEGRVVVVLPGGGTEDADAEQVWRIIDQRLTAFDLEVGIVHRGQAAVPAGWPPDAADRVDLSTDGCSSPVGDHPWGHDFTVACWKHDFGYRNLRRLDEQYHRDHGVHWNESARKRVDDRFREDLLSVCAEGPDAVARRCRSTAQAYHRAVRIGGDGITLGELDDLSGVVIEYLWPFW